MARQADLLSYLPPFLQEVEQFQTYAEITNPELTRIWELNEKLFRNQFILTADEDGISHFEKFPNLAPVGTLEERRQRLLDNWNTSPLFTRQVLYERLKRLCGEGHFELDISHFSDYEIYLNLIPPLLGKLDEITHLFSWDYILPANMLYDITGTFEEEIDQELDLLLYCSQFQSDSLNLQDKVSSSDVIYVDLYMESDILDNEDSFYVEFDLEEAQSLLEDFLTEENLSQSTYNTDVYDKYNYLNQNPNPNVAPIQHNPLLDNKLEDAFDSIDNYYLDKLETWLSTFETEEEGNLKSIYASYLRLIFRNLLGTWRENYSVEE